MSRREGEVVRLKHQIKMLRTLVDSFEASINDSLPSTVAAHAIAAAAANVVDHAARLEAYDLVDTDHAKAREYHTIHGADATIEGCPCCFP